MTMKILVAEDEEITREILVETLKKWEYEVTAVGNGKEALDVLLQPSPPPIVLLDWKMPVMDGLVTLRNIRSHDELKNVYVILLTSVGDQVSVQRAIGAKANDYILKPYNIDNLRERLAKAREFLEDKLSSDPSAG